MRNPKRLLSNVIRKKMKIIEPEFRCPTKSAIDKLAEMFSLPNTPYMQDWEWEVADANRIEEFIKVYKNSSLTDDEKFTLMEIIIQSFEDTKTELHTNSLWQTTLNLLKKNYKLHAYTVWYWSSFENGSINDAWRVAPFMRELYESNV
jgi:hypothetical protein